MVHSGNRNTRNHVNIKLVQIYFQNFTFRWRILQPKCNFLHGFFRCNLPVEMADMELRITSMQGTHMFRRDGTCHVIKCNPWSTRLCPHPTIIKKLKTYLELEGKFGPKPQLQFDQFRHPQPDTNPHVKKDSKATKKEEEIDSHKEM